MNCLIVLNVVLVILPLTIPLSTSILANQVPEIESDPDRNRSYILCIGLPRSGKSSIINELFNTSIVPEGHLESNKPEISEFRIKSPNCDSELRIIDAPELGNGEISDVHLDRVSARFISSLKDYLENHNELRYRAPDFVVISTPAKGLSNNTFFVNIMRGLTILDKKFTNHNLVFLVEHEMGEGGVDSQSSIISAIENTIKENTLLASPLNIISEAYKINNPSFENAVPQLSNSWPPKLCELIKNISLQNTAGKFYCNNSPSCFELVSQFSFHDLKHPKTVNMLQLLKVINLKSEETEISKTLSEMFNKLPENKRFSKDTLVYLQKAFHFQGIDKLSGIPKTDMEVASLFISLNIRRLQDPKVLLFLKESLGLQVVNFPFDLLVGKGYHILQDKASQFSPLEMDLQHRQLTESGYATTAEVNVTSKIGMPKEIYYEKIVNAKEYLKNRAIMLGIGLNERSLNNNLENLSVKPGFNIISRNACPSVFVEFRTVEFKLEKNVQFRRKLLSDMESFKIFNASSPKSVHNWLRLLNVYGTHLITNSNGGGSIEFFIDGYLCYSADLKDIVNNLVEGIVADPPPQFLLKGKIRISGGDPKFYSENPILFFGGGETSLFKLWKVSLFTRPTILPNFVKIKSTIELLNVSHPLLSLEMGRAAEYIFNDQHEENLIIELRKKNLNAQNRLQLLTREKLNCDLEKASLSSNIESIESGKTQLQVRADQISQELGRNKEMLSQTRIIVEDEKENVRSLNDNSQTCQGTLDGFKGELQSERTKIQNVKQIMSTTESKLNALRNSELNLDKQITQCNSRRCNACGAPKSLAIPLHRYYHSRNGDHFYTTNWAELGGGKGKYRYEGVQARIFPSQISETVPLFRYYNRGNGDHFYTTNWAELGGGRGGYGHEGIAGYLYPTQVAGSVPLYRYYNRRNGDHFYTTNWSEIGAGRWNYVHEGNAGYVCS